MNKWRNEKFTLYDKAECPFCWKIRLACAELNLPLDTLDYARPEYEKKWKMLNPLGTVPVFLHNDLLIAESSVIMEYLCDLSEQLLPLDAKGRVKTRLLHRYSDVVLGSGLREVIFEKREKLESEWDLQRIELGRDKFYKDLVYLESSLGGRDCFSADYTMADCAITARLGLAEKYNVPIPDGLSDLKRWFGAMKQRPSYVKTMPSYVKTRPR